MGGQVTVSASSTYNPDIGTLLLAAHEMCGVINENQSLSPAQVARGRRQLDLLVDFLQTEGVAARTRVFAFVTLESGIAEYTLGPTTLDVEGSASYVPAGQPATAANGETVLLPLPLREWSELSAKDAAGRPTRYYPDRSADQIVVRFWPIPTDAEAGAQVRFVSHRLRADNLDAAATADVERYWNQYLVIMLGARLARSYSMHDVAASLIAESKPILEKCRAAAAPQDTTDFVLGYGGYSR